MNARIARAWDFETESLLKFFSFVPSALIVMTGIGALWLYFFVQSLLPVAGTNVELKGLFGEVRVTRDANGAPGIIADNDEDLAKVFGFITAQDRLWQIDYLRRAGQGRLTEILGSAYLETDHLARMMHGPLQREDASSPEERKWLENYVSGINKYIAHHASKPAVEFSLLDYRPEPFTPQDVHWILFALALESSVGMKLDPFAADLFRRDMKNPAAWLPKDPAGPTPLLLSDLGKISAKGPLFEGMPHSGAPGFDGGCVWTAGGARTRGKSMLGAVVYQPPSAPGFWYKARLMSKTRYVAGAFIPGVPAAFSGTNGRISWACASLPVDDADLFLEAVEPEGPPAVFRIDRVRKCREKKETYNIKGRSVTRSIWYTDTGPLVSEPVKGRAYSMRWTGAEGTGLFAALHGVNEAKTENDVKAAAKLLVAPCLRIGWAGPESRHGIVFAGLAPIRCRESDGISPMPAWTGAHDWIAAVPLETLLKQGAADLCVTTNEKPAAAQGLFLGSYWQNDGRAGAITSLWNSKDEHTRDTVLRMLNDTRSSDAEAAARLIKELPASEVQEVRKLLEGWDYVMARDSAPAALTMLFYRELLKETASKLLGPECGVDAMSRYWAVSALVGPRLRDRLARPDDEFRAIAVTCLKRAVENGRKLMGDDMRTWKRGTLSPVWFDHPIATRSHLLEAVYDVGPVAMGGAWDTVSGAVGFGSESEGPVSLLREMHEMTELPENWSIVGMGASGHFFSPHYKDQTAMWSAGRAYRDPAGPDELSRSASASVVFRPMK